MGNVTVHILQESALMLCAGNAMEWAVRRLDAGLVKAENDPPPAARALINAARGPAGEATVKGVTAAARITVQVGTEALKVCS